jgi:hypothetical protein
VYEKVGGYGGGRLYNPDKWFHWKIMAELDFVYYIDTPLFQYRWHQNNQANQQQQNQVLKYWMDEYRNCFEVSKNMLTKTSLQNEDVAKAFIRHCILAYCFSFMRKKDYTMAKRIFNFGKSCYPKYIKQDKYYFPISLMLSFRFLTPLVAKLK